MPLELELSIDRVAKTGEGIGAHQGRSVLVDGALPGDRVLVDVDLGAQVRRGRLLEVRVKSSDRRPSPCPLSDRCGGCDWLHYSEARQREAKQEIVLSALEHVAGIPRASMKLFPYHPAPASLGYRRRAVMHFQNGKLCFHQRHSNRLVEIPRCPALASGLEDLPSELSSVLRESGREIDEVHLLAAGKAASFALFLRVAASERHLRVCRQAVQRLQFQGAVVVSKDGHRECIADPTLRSFSPLCPGLTLFLRPDVFAQANAAANDQLCSAVLDLMRPQPEDRVLELFAGTGNLTFPVAVRAGTVWAVEATGTSLQLARRTAADGGLKNVRLIQGEASKVCENLASENESFDVLLADPPRQGARSLGRWAKQLKVRQVLLVACDAIALAREAADLRKAGFSPDGLQLIDMFPQTHHVEAVIAFRRNDGPELVRDEPGAEEERCESSSS